MELMDKSLDKLYQLVYKKLNEKIPEVIVGKMADSVSKGNEWADKPSQQILCDLEIIMNHYFLTL